MEKNGRHVPSLKGQNLRHAVNNTLRLLGYFMALFADELAVAFLLFLVLPRFGLELPLELKLLTLGLLGAISVMTYRALQTVRMPPLVGAEAMIGANATAITPLAPIGQVRIWGEVWTAEMEQGTAEHGERVKIKKVTGLKLVVTKST